MPAPDHALPHLEEFSALVIQDEALAQALCNIIRRDEFAARMVELGAERGFFFTAADVERTLIERKLEWTERWM
jgi:hypothetical protein